MGAEIDNILDEFANQGQRSRSPEQHHFGVSDAVTLLHQLTLRHNNYTEKKSGAKMVPPPGAVLWCVTHLQPWHHFSTTFKGGAIFASTPGAISGNSFFSEGRAIFS